MADQNIVAETDLDIDDEDAMADERDEADDEGDDEGDDDDTDDVNALKRHQIVEATITSTSPTEIMFDLGEERSGVLTERELGQMTAKALEELSVGESVTVMVIRPKNDQGQTIVSINRALEVADWDEAQQYYDNKEVYDGTIGGYNKGGLMVRFGRLRGFVPQSQISETRSREAQGDTPQSRFGPMVNEPIGVKVMEVDRAKNRLILSERLAMREVRQRSKEALLTELEVGEERDGTVTSLEKFGAFVDIGGAEGLVHITEISWNHLTHPNQVLKPGEQVRVRVINTDAERNRIGLSIKQLLPDPWEEIAANYSDGPLVHARVTKLTKFGAFAEVKDLNGIEGLIHISEMAEQRIEHPRDVVSRNQDLILRVINVDPKERRLGLSLRKVDSPVYMERDMARAYQLAADEPLEPLADIEATAADIDTSDEPAAPIAQNDGESRDDAPHIDETSVEEVREAMEQATGDSLAESLEDAERATQRADSTPDESGEVSPQDDSVADDEAAATEQNGNAGSATAADDMSDTASMADVEDTADSDTGDSDADLITDENIANTQAAVAEATDGSLAEALEEAEAATDHADSTPDESGEVEATEPAAEDSALEEPIAEEEV